MSVYCAIQFHYTNSISLHMTGISSASQQCKWGMRGRERATKTIKSDKRLIALFHINSCERIAMHKSNWFIDYCKLNTTPTTLSVIKFALNFILIITAILITTIRQNYISFDGHSFVNISVINDKSVAANEKWN